MPTLAPPSLHTRAGWGPLVGLLVACGGPSTKPEAPPAGSAPPSWPAVAVGLTAGLPPDLDHDGVDAPADCDDHNPAVYPGAEELCGDDLVNDCARREAGAADELCVVVSGSTEGFATYRWADPSYRDDMFNVTSVGDIDGDGRAELGAGLILDGLIVGERWDESGELVPVYSPRGSVLLLPGPLSPSTMDEPMVVRHMPQSVYGTTEADRIGAGLTGLGDLDGDGYGELIFGNLGAPDMLWLASGPAFTDMSEATLIYSEPLGGCASNGATSSPDLSGDGRPDVVIGNPCADLVLVYEGASLHGAEGLPAPIARLQSGLGWEEGFGGGLQAEADLTGDGLVDLVVAAPRANGVDGVDRPTCVLVYPGPVRGELGPDDAALQLTSEIEAEAEGGSQAGWALSAGDADGDGYADLAVGDPHFVDRAEYDLDAGWRPGRTSIFPGPLSRSMLLNEAASELQSTSASDFGGQVDMRRDLDGDGRADLFVTAGVNRGENCTCGPGHAGGNEAYIFLAPFGGHRFAASAEVTFRNYAVEDWGSQGEVTGDLTGDGWPDVLIGGPGNYFQVFALPPPGDAGWGGGWR